MKNIFLLIFSMINALNWYIIFNIYIYSPHMLQPGILMKYIIARCNVHFQYKGLNRSND